mgnify:FL=1
MDARIEAELERYRRIGHDVAVEPARAVPLAIELRVCVKPEYLVADIERELRDRFGAGLRRDGLPGFFHPDRLRLGAPVYASALIAEAQGIVGVSHVDLLTLTRQETLVAGSVPDDGVLEMALREIARADNHPDHPDRGWIKFILGGGR